MSELTLEQKKHLYENGWVLIPQVVPATMIKEARSAINSTVESYLDSIQIRSSDLRSDERLKGLLFNTEASSLAKSALGNKATPSQNIQAALRFPAQEHQPRSLVPHIDGFHPAADDKPAAIRPFAALIGFFLNDTENDWSGNFTVWPDTHRMFEEYFQKHKPDPNLKFGIPPVDLPQPIQVKAKAGDMLIAHYQLAHTASTNLSGNVRYAVYFRFHHDDKPKDSIEVLSDIWRYWDGMKEVI